MGNITSLGGALPLLSQSFSTLGRLEGQIRQYGDGRADDRLALRQLSERNRAEEAIAAQKTEREQALINAQSSDDERRRTAALKRAVARQRAAYGGAGVESSEDGSGKAVLLGFFNESQQDQAAQDSVYNVRRQILNDNLSSIKQRNLLEESQLAERNRKKRRGLFS
jgi:colicin import membrane protein